MPLDPRFASRLAAIGITSDSGLHQMFNIEQSEGSEFLDGFLKRLEEAAANYHIGFPRLREYESECRRIVPVPTIAELTPLEEEQFWILLEKMREIEATGDPNGILERRPNQAAIYVTSKAGLLAAKSLFGDRGAIILLESERDRWFKDVYPRVDEGFWWYTFAWWTVNDWEPEEYEVNARETYPEVPGCTYWLVECGNSWGPMAGGASQELWRWDGTKAEYVDFYSCITY
jgi:hypothetical protein